MKQLICDSIELTNINRSRLFELIASATNNVSIDKIAEIAYYLQDKFDAEELPQTIENPDYPNAKLISHDIFKDTVRLQYDHTSVRFFELEKSATEFSETGKGWGYSDSTEQHPFKGVYISPYYTEMSKERWLNNGK